MGYSIAARIRSEAKRQKVLGFLKGNFRGWPEVEGREGDCYASNPTDDLSYDSNKASIGIDYGACSGWERVYVYDFVRWVAIRFGDRRRKFKLDSGSVSFPGPVPFMVYDGYEAWPLLVVDSKQDTLTVPEDHRWCCCDRFGARLSEDHYADALMEGLFSLSEEQLAQYEQERTALKGDRQQPAALLQRHTGGQLERNVRLIREEFQRLESLSAVIS